MIRYAGVPIARRYPLRGDKPGHFETDDFFNLFVTDAPYTQLFDYQGGTNVVYLGRAEPGHLGDTGLAVWQIRKFTYDGSNNVLSVSWANGTAQFNQVWDTRVAQPYS